MGIVGKVKRWKMILLRFTLEAQRNEGCEPQDVSKLRVSFQAPLRKRAGRVGAGELKGRGRPTQSPRQDRPTRRIATVVKRRSKVKMMMKNRQR